MYEWSIPVVILDTVAKNRLYLRNRWEACEKVVWVVPGKIQKVTSNFILIVWKIYQFARNWSEHSVPFAQRKYIEYFNNYDRISTNEQI